MVFWTLGPLVLGLIWFGMVILLRKDLWVGGAPTAVYDVNSGAPLTYSLENGCNVQYVSVIMNFLPAYHWDKY